GYAAEHGQPQLPDRPPQRLRQGGGGRVPFLARGSDRQSKADVKAARDESERLRAQVNRLEKQLAEADSPSYAGLGGRAAEMLGLAEEQAEEVLARANQQAED